MSKFLHNDDDNDDAKTIAIPLVWSENSRTNKILQNSLENDVNRYTYSSGMM